MFAQLNVTPYCSFIISGRPGGAWLSVCTRRVAAALLVIHIVFIAMWHPVQAQDATVLEEITVEPAAEPEADLPLGTGISGDTLSTAPGSGGDPLRGLQAVPGLVFNSDEDAVPAVRGARPDDNYFQVDFAPGSYLFHFGGAISVFNADLVESFNIYPSAYGAEFSGVVGGVFDVKLRDPQVDRFHTKLDISFLQAGFLVEGPVNEKQSFYIAGRRSYLDLFVKDLIDEPDVQFTDFPNYTDYQAKYVWRFSPDSTLRFTANGATDDADLTLSAEAEDVATDPIFAGRIYEATGFNEQALTWEERISPELSVKSVLTHSTQTAEAQAGSAGALDIEDDKWLLKSHVEYQVTDNHQIKLGLEYAHSDSSFDIALNAPNCSEFEPDCRYTGAERLEVTEQAKINSVKAFVADSWYVNDRLSVFPGVALQREDYLGKQFVEPRLAAEYALRDDLILTAGLGLYHQMPGIGQVNEVFGNPKLGYIEAQHTSVGVQKTFANGWSVASELYYNKLDKLITSNEEDRYRNDGEGSSIGLDTLIRKQLTDKWSGWMSVSLSEATRRDKRSGREFDFEYNQPLNVSMVANYKFSPRWTFGARLWMHSGAPYTPITGATPDPDIEGLYNPEYGQLNSRRLPTFNRLDLRIDRTFKRKGTRQISGYVELLNVLGSENISGYAYNADYSTRIPQEQLPAFIGFGVKTEF